MKKITLNLKKIVNFRPLFFIFMAFFFGILSARKLFIGNAWYIAFVVVGLVGVIVSCCLYKKIITMVLLIATFFIGTGFYYIGRDAFMGREYVGVQNVVARVTDNRKEYSYNEIIVLENVYIGERSAKNIQLSVYLDEEIDFQTGDILHFSANVNRVQLFELGSFNSFYLRDNTPYEAAIDASEISIIRGDLKADERVRAKMREVLYANMSENSAGVAFAVLTGDRNFIENDVYSSYKYSGIVHLLTVSGLHITFLAGLIAWILKKCKVNRFINLGITATILILYAYFCGFSPSVLRAVIMGLALIIAPLLGKEYDPLTSLGGAGLIILLISPLNAFDGGFLMSFFSVMAIFLLYRSLFSIGKKFLPKWVASSFAVSISAQIGIMPFLAMYWSEFNPLTFFVNLLVIPFFGIIFPLLFVTVFIAMIPYFGWVLKLSDWGFMGVYEIAKFFASTKTIIKLQPFDIFISLLILLGTFAVSCFMMVKRYVKVFIISGLFFIGTICLVISSIAVDLKRTTSVYLKSNYSSSMSLFLTNKEGQVAYIGSEIGGLEEEYLFKNKIKKIDYCFMLDNWQEREISDMRRYDFDSLVTNSTITGVAEEIVVEDNSSDILGGYRYKYWCKDGEFVGLQMDFDNVSIFIATNRNLSYNSYVYLRDDCSQLHFDVVFLGNKQLLAERFVNSDKILARYGNVDVDYSYQRNGNLMVDFKEGQHIRSID